MGESKQHRQQKERIRDIARAKGLIALNEIPFNCWSGYHDKPICYYVDIFIINRQGEASIVEVDGYKGHRSIYMVRRDTRRTEDIRNLWGYNINIRRFTIEELEAATDEEIIEELGIDISK